MVEVIGPQQTVLITSRAEITEFGKIVEKDDIDTVFWHMPISSNEKIYSIAVHNSKNVNQLIKKSGIFVINFLSFDMENKAVQCDKLHGQHIDKFKMLDLIKIEAEHIEAPYIKEACAFMECQVQSLLEFSDSTVYIAKTINAKGIYDVKRLFHIKEDLFTTTKI